MMNPYSIYTRMLCAVALAVATIIGPTAPPAAADSSACTHHWSGPQICIRLKGHNGWNSVTGIWVNPPGRVMTRAVSLHWNGSLFDKAVAKRVGRTLSHTWSNMQTGTDTRLCVKFRGRQRMACETTRYVGDRASS